MPLEKKERTIIRIVASVLFVIYISYLFYLTFFSHVYGRIYLHRSINFIPFKTIMIFLLSSFNVKSVMINILGNIYAFVPMGFLLPFTNKNFFGYKNVILTVLFVSVMIELLQYLGGVGVSDVDDMILNLFGGIFGYILSRLVLKQCNGAHPNLGADRKT